MGERELRDLKRGDRVSEYTIRDIVGRNDDFMVFTTTADDGRLMAYWTSRNGFNFSEEQMAHLNSYNRRDRELRDKLPGDTGAIEYLADALYYALRVPRADFSEFDRWVESQVEKLKATARTRVASSIAASVALLVIVIAAASLLHVVTPVGEARTFQYSFLALAATAGAIGAWCSVLQQLSKVETPRFPGRLEASAAAVTRIALGMVFGAVGYLGATNELFLTALLTGPASVMMIGFIAGISERLVPGLIEDLESGKVSRPPRAGPKRPARA